MITIVFLGYFIVALGLAATTTTLIRHLATKAEVLDRPTTGTPSRKIHHKPIPLMGGAAIFLTIAIITTIALLLGHFNGIHIRGKFLIGLTLAGLILTFGGALDDRYNLKPIYQLITPALAILAIVASGIGIPYISNPLSTGLIHLDTVSWTVVWWQGIPYKFTLFADVFAFLWIMGATYTTKVLDGLDGLVSGITVIGALIVAAVSMMQDVAQPDTALLAIIISGSFAGFLIFNFNPASIFLGEGGSTLAGFLLGVLAIISGGKIATALLILALPITDTAYTIFRRLKSKSGVANHDRLHLHHRLLDAGLSQRQVVLIYYFVAALFGTSTLILEGPAKIIAIAFAASLLPILIYLTPRFVKKA